MRHACLLLLALAATPARAQDPIRVFISVDMEGISGIAHPEMLSESGSEYARGRALMVADVNAAIEGAREAGATGFLVNDSHGSTAPAIPAWTARSRSRSSAPKPSRATRRAGASRTRRGP